MTPKDLAVQAATKFNANSPDHFPGRPLFEGLVASAVSTAIAETVERCARVTEEVGGRCHHEGVAVPAMVAAIADAIRAVAPSE